MEMWLQPPLSSLYPPLSETAGENNVENNTNLFSVRLNIRFEFSAVREPSQRGGGGGFATELFFKWTAYPSVYWHILWDWGSVKKHVVHTFFVCFLSACKPASRLH